MSPELRSAIQSVYLAFGDVPKPDDISGCPCCIESKNVDVLLSKPLRDITPDELTRYAASAFNTAGSLEDYIYFLPRILEILAIEYAWYPCPEVVSGKFADADFSNWSPSRRAAVFSYFDAVFEDLLTEAENGVDIDSWVFALGTIHRDIGPVLTRVETRPKALVKFYEENSDGLIQGRLTNSFWEPDHPAYNQVLAWFESTKIKKLINESYDL